MLGEKEKGLLLAVAPYVSVNHNADGFIEALDRLVDANPAPACETLGVVLDHYKPSYVYQARLRGLLEKLAQTEFKGESLEYMNKVRHLKGIESLYKKYPNN